MEDLCLGICNIACARFDTVTAGSISCCAVDNNLLRCCRKIAAGRKVITRGVGKKSLDEIRNKLKEFNITLEKK